MKLLASLLAVACIAGCGYLTESRPLLKQSDYEKMIAGRIDAEYIGTDNCLFKCHQHDKLANYFKKSVHAEQINKETELPLVNCESCHGAGSLAVQNIKEVKGRMQCDYETLINLRKLPAGAKNLTCLKCHTVSSTPNLAMWRGSGHDLAGVSCSDCHKLHTSIYQKVGLSEQVHMCLGCHTKVKGEMAGVSHHPLNEKKMVCTDCHNPHGTSHDKMLKKETVRETCASCHREKTGPFVFEHADLTDDCMACHRPHGSMNDNLLKAREPILCLRCHEGHHTAASPTMQGLSTANRAKFYNRCTDCHLSIHGSDRPGQKLLR